METCNIECCKCIEKKDTQLNPISSKIYKSNSLNKKRIHKIRSFELSQILIIQKDNKENKDQENNSLITLEEKNNTLIKKYNENTNSDTSYKDISFKFTKKSIKDQFYNTNNKNNNIEISKSKTKEKVNIDNFNDKKYIDEYNKEENLKIAGKKTPINVPVCLRTNFKSSKNTYSKYFDKIEDSKQNLDMTDNNKNRQKKISNIFPTKYNQKDKYITYFTDDLI
jgi:hypothetical protein